MCRIWLIILLFGLFVVGYSSADGSVCKNDRSRITQNLTVYNIENCTNTEIELGDQNARTSLNYVKAFNNQISRISDDTFKSAKELTYIDLRENKIEEISVGAFKDQGKLQHLYLKQNKLTRIEVRTFDSLTELKDLWLQENQLSVIEKGLFDKNTNLEYLFLSENQIVAIGSTVFQNLNQQVNINLVGNLCSNETFSSNRFDKNFDCFKNYELLKPYLKQIHQLESETKTSNDDKVTYKSEKDRNDLTVNFNDLFRCKRSLSDCEAINQEKENLAGKLKSKESELNQHLGRIGQLESQTETCKKDESACVTEKNRLNQNLNCEIE
jgi:Leucine-rich repeat (LRR) protein